MAQPLALELYHTIIQHVDNMADLLSLARCCSAFRDEAQRCLFRHVEPKSEGQHTRFISAINASPLRLGPLIHAYCISEGTESNKDPYDHAAYGPLSLALHSMCNLEHLRNGRWLPSTVLQGCVFKLRTLVWNSHTYKSDLLFLFYDFLPTQSSIKRLHVHVSKPSELAEVPTNLCPMLDFLSARENKMVSGLVRDDRLITRFQWRMTGTLPAMTTRQLNHLEYLLCSIQELNRDTSFSQRLTSLIFLELYLKRIWSADDAGLLLRMLQFLQDLPCLEVLVVDPNYNDYTAFTSAYQLAFELRPTLKYIDVLDNSNQCYHRFFPPGDGDNGVLVSNTCVHKREVLGWRREYGVGPAWSKYI